MKKLILITLVVSLPSLSHSAPLFQACQNVTFVKEGDYNKDKRQWDQKLSECKDDSLQVVPTTAFTSLSYKDVNQNVLQSISAISFLSEIGKRTIENLDQNDFELSVLEKCLQKKNVSRGELDKISKGLTCSNFIQNLRASVNKKIPDIRHELSLMGQINVGDADKALTSLKVDQLVDYQLKHSGGLIAGGVPQADFTPMTDTEVKTASKEFKDTLVSIRKEWNKITSAEVAQEISTQGFKKEDPRYQHLYEARMHEKEKNYLPWGRAKLREFQNEHKKKYFAVAGASPFLLHIGKENASDEEFLKTIPLLKNSIAQEKKRAEKALKSATITYDTTHTDPDLNDLLYFLGNKPVIESYLKEHKNVCATATGLSNFLAEKDARTQGLIMGAVIAGGVFLPMELPAAAAGVGLSLSASTVGALFGLGTGIIFEAQAINDYQVAKEKFHSGVGSLEEMSDAKLSLAVQTVLHPLDYVGGGAVLGKAMKSANRVKEIAAMRKAGLDEESINKLVTFSESADPKARRSAQVEMAKYSWGDIIGVKPSEYDMEVLTSLIQHGAVGPDTKSLKVARTLKLVVDLSTAEKMALEKMSEASSKAAQALLKVQEDIATKPGNHETNFLKRLEELGTPKEVAKKMCQCASVCKKTASLKNSQFQFICDL